jgi:hypothetical protein
MRKVMTMATMVKFSRALRAKARTSDGRPTVSDWLTRVSGLHEPLLTEAIEGIWTGREGRAALELTGTKTMLCVGWYAGKVEWTYLS